jgi:hypothetical protein
LHARRPAPGSPSEAHRHGRVNVLVFDRACPLFIGAIPCAALPILQIFIQFFMLLHCGISFRPIDVCRLALGPRKLRNRQAEVCG